MFFNSKKRPEMSDAAKEKVKDLKIKITLELETKGGYNEPNVAEIVVTKQLQSTTDTPVREILKEVDSLLDGAAIEFATNVEQSRHLSDGYHAEQAAKENV